MTFADFEDHITKIEIPVETVEVGGQSYLVMTVTVPGGSHAGSACEVAIRRTQDEPWIPEAKIHTRPHLTTMGQNASQASELGGDWQYLSRRFDNNPPTPKGYYAHILTVVGEL